MPVSDPAPVLWDKIQAPGADPDPRRGPLLRSFRRPYSAESSYSEAQAFCWSRALALPPSSVSLSQ